jgi:hypothetical protein
VPVLESSVGDCDHRDPGVAAAAGAARGQRQDNDMPGGDIQNFVAWPSTYGPFNSVDTGALATFE